MPLAAGQYVGNPDFRDYIAKVAPEYLGFVGNDADFKAGGGINMDKLNQVGGVESNYAHQSQLPQGAVNTIKSLWSQYTNLAGPAYAPTNYGAGYGYQAPARAANFDVGGTFNSAYGEAAASQNPLYDKYLNQFLAEQANAKAAQQHTFDETTSNLDTALKNTTEANTISQQRTGEDVARAEGQIATKADQFQTDSGTQFANDRLQQASDLSKAGLTGGIGAQKTEAVQTARNTQEARQGAEFDQQKQAQELLKARTFEDLSRSTANATAATAKGKANAQFNLDNWIEAAKIKEDQYRTQNEVDRKQAILDERNRIAKKKFQQFLGGLSDPVRVATINKYTGRFG